MPLKVRAIGTFESAIELLGTSPGVERQRRSLREARERLDEPMRVAIVGQIKAGKSTMLNALLGQELVATGVEELTFNVNWLRYGDSRLVVHFKNGRPPEERSLAELEELTARREEAYALLSQIRYVEVFHPNQILQSINLIDTPGLASFFERDSLNSLAFLGIDAEYLDELTIAHSSDSDAVLCLFSRGLLDSDRALVEVFQGQMLGHATPINAIGVLTKVDSYWSPIEPDADPMLTGKRIADRISEEPGAERVFYAVLPVCGLLAMGAQVLTETDLAVLGRLGELPEGTLGRLLKYAATFAAREDDEIPATGAERSELLRKLGQYGVWLACRYVRQGVEGVDELGEKLEAHSGVVELRQMLTSHFGNRAFLIKLLSGLRRVRTASYMDRQALNARDMLASQEVAGELEALEASEHAFAELDLLRMHYSSRAVSSLTESEARELLHVSGEFGTSCSARLGTDESAPISEMLQTAKARLHYWRRKEDAFGADGPAVTTARVLARSYERILFHLREAQRHLELDA